MKFLARFILFENKIKLNKCCISFVVLKPFYSVIRILPRVIEFVLIFDTIFFIRFF